MTKTIFETIKNSVPKLVRHDGEYGIEIETETEDSYPALNMKYWSSHGDGSLRNFGVEYVLRAPVVYDEVHTALQEFADKTSKLRFLESTYTSVHVHMNMLNETFKTMANTITTYALLERVLARYSGPDRESNLFCLSLGDAEGCLENIQTVLGAIERKAFAKMYLNEDNAKYSALNLATFSKIGSLEVRTFRGTQDIKEIGRWVSLLHKIKTFAKGDLTPVRIVEIAYNDPTEFFTTVFGELAGEFKYKDKEELLLKNMYYGSKIATVSRNWDTFGIPPEKKQTQQVYIELLDSIAAGMFGARYNTLNVVQKILVEESFIQNYGDVRIINQGIDA